jgi:DNA-binding LacI/PurR family transcriptional regulator
MSVTQQEIADKLNISRSLVARALKGYDEVSPVTRQRVEEAAREMGYDLNTNQAARALIARRYGQKARTGVIAVAFPPLVSPSPHHMVFFAPLLRGVESEATACGMEVFTFNVRQGELPRMVREGNVDGVISIGFSPQDISAIRALGLPVVTFQSVCENAHSVMVDDRRGIYLATRHLLEQGHRKIAYLGVTLRYQHGRTDELRLQGYKDALEEFDIPIRQEWINTDLPFPDTSSHKYCSGCGKCAACIGWQTIKAQAGAAPGELPPFTAIVCYHDPIAMGVIDQAANEGINVPEDLSVVGFDDVSHLYHFEPHVTSISFNREEMGHTAVELVQEESEYQHRIFPVQLKIHGSTAALEKRSVAYAK